MPNKSIKIEIPKDWRIGQFIFNFLEWLADKGYAPRDNVARLSDPFHLSDNELLNYWKKFLKENND